MAVSCGELRSVPQFSALCKNCRGAFDLEEPSGRKIIEMEELIMGVYDELKARGLILAS